MDGHKTARHVRLIFSRSVILLSETLVTQYSTGL